MNNVSKLECGIERLEFIDCVKTLHIVRVDDVMK